MFTFLLMSFSFYFFVAFPRVPLFFFKHVNLLYTHCRNDTCGRL
jgi:hypothetical protein